MVIIKEKETKEFKREYIPVIIAVIILILLIAGLIYVINYKKEGLVKPIPNEEFKQEELVVDVSDSKCSKKELQELSNIANKVELKFEETEISTGFEIDMDAVGAPSVEKFATVYQLVFENVTDDIYLVIGNSSNSNTKTLTTKNIDKDGKLTYQTLITDKIIDYYVEIHSNKYDCRKEILRKLNFVVPIYNIYSEYDFCKEYPDFEYCQRFIKKDTINYQEFNNLLDQYLKDNKITTTRYTGDYNTTGTNENNNVDSNKKNNNLFIIILAIVIIIIILIITTVLLRKRGKK